jgi:FkbM family methyltransferase
MGMLFEVASRIARSPLDTPLRWLAGRLTRYTDIADNLNNCDFASNGEGFVMRRGAPHWRVAFDVGANMGDWARDVVGYNGACAVHSFEASPSTFEVLRERVGGVAGITLHAMGAGEVEGEMAFHDQGRGSVLSSFVSRDPSGAGHTERVVPVRVRPLDAVRAELGLEHVDFIKVDTEGYELPVLRGLRQTMTERRVDCVQFEYGGTWLDAHARLHDACALFATHGFKVYRLLPDRVTPLTYEAQRDEHFKYANFLATHDPSVFTRWGIPAA